LSDEAQRFFKTFESKWMPFVSFKKTNAMNDTTKMPAHWKNHCRFLKRITGSIRNAFLVASLLFCLPGCNAIAQNACEWPCFHGPDRTNKSPEKGLLKEWPPEGPELKWTAGGLGEGYSTVSVANGRIYTAGANSGQTYVYCFDTEGKQIWKKPNGKAWSTTMSHARSYTGARSTPTYDNGILYHLGETGRLAAFNAKTGEEQWHKELSREFDAGDLEYGYAESVYIDGDHLYVRPAGKKGFQVCLSKQNGELIWANTEIPGVEGYSSPVIMEFNGCRQLINSSSDGYYALDTKTGKLLWKVNYKNRQGLNVADAVIFDDYVFISSGYGKGSMLIRLEANGQDIYPETIWQSELMDNHHGGVILHEGYLYGSGSNSRGWFCLELLTGRQMWKTAGKGSVTFADGMLYLLDERGTLQLVRATPEKYDPAGEFLVPEGGRGMYWAHPVVCNGTLYVRHTDQLYAYDIAAK
jgi:outer membrane protein assembly factor BamB